MEKCIGCEWNEEGMICPQYSFCQKSMKKHDAEEINKTLDKMIKHIEQLNQHTDVISCDTIVKMLKANKYS